MNSDEEFELKAMIKDLETDIEKFPGMGVSNYALLRVLYLLQSVLKSVEKSKETASE